MAYGQKLMHWDISFFELIVVFYFKIITQEWMGEKKRIVIEGDNINSPRFG